MDYVRVRKTDLAHNTSQIIRNVLRGQPNIIENHGQPEVAIVDVKNLILTRIEPSGLQFMPFSVTKDTCN